MLKTPSHTFWLILLALILLAAFVLDIAIGSISIPLSNIVEILSNQSDHESWNYIIWEFRIPKAITAIIVGIALAISGLLIQTLFRNALAGPYVLGISSGSSLGVALIILGSYVLPSVAKPIVQSPYALIIASCLGSSLVLLFILSVAAKIKSSASLLVIGLMFSSLTSSIVGILSYFSSAEELRKFTIWSLGSLGGLSWEKLYILLFCLIIGIIISIILIKPLNALLLGENYAKSSGVNVSKSRYLIILITSLLTGSITAFTGPIVFIGLAVPHMAKLLFKTGNHAVLLLSSSLLGGIVMLICDSIAQLPFSDQTLPINAVTSLIGAPMVIALIFRKKTL